MATIHLKSFVMPLLLITNLLILLSFTNTIPAEARHLLETTSEPEVPDDQSELPELPNFPGLPNLADLPNFQLPPLPFNIPNFPGFPGTNAKPEAVSKLPNVAKDKPSFTEPHSAANP
ncbi:hypothetical protein TorRG33x02_058900 [Trema orientale]|uniref:Hydroxyproline-rich glycoprotein family protein n=1 Tax=Trema orientale TaxID=63057 RepID=A0A2P5FKI3_TREOI|nr:hypothetical protein TorRG33x02_058900 [Trema orientale]